MHGQEVGEESVLDEGSYKVCGLVLRDMEEICQQYIQPLCDTYYLAAREMKAVRPIQEVLAWHYRMLKARLQSAMVGFRPIQGLLDVVLGHRGTQGCTSMVSFCWLRGTIG